jgi:hypothetical protein
MNIMRFTVNQTINDTSNNNNSVSIVTRSPFNVDRTLSNAIIQQPAEKKMKWGAPVWYLFHTLTYKIKDSSFFAIKNQLLRIFLSICKNLPCPTCSAHATEYMNNINFQAIQSKENLKMLFFTFHNAVNKKKGYSIFTYEEFESKYSKANTVNIVNYFIQSFQNRTLNVRYIADDMHRKQITILAQTWLTNNLHHFDQ